MEDRKNASLEADEMERSIETKLTEVEDRRSSILKQVLLASPILKFCLNKFHICIFSPLLN